MRTIPALLIPALSTLALLAACGQSGTVTAEDGTETTYSTANGDFNATVTDSDGESIDVRSGMNNPVDLPAGFTVYPGAQVTSNTTMEQADGRGAILAMTSSDSPDKIMEYYRREAETAGFTISTQVTTGDSQMIVAEGGENSGLQLTVRPINGSTMVTMMVSQGMQD